MTLPKQTSLIVKEDCFLSDICLYIEEIFFFVSYHLDCICIKPDIQADTHTAMNKN